jgi:hypothetical protein
MALGLLFNFAGAGSGWAAGWPEIWRSNVRSPTQFGRPDVWQVAARDSHVDAARLKAREILYRFPQGGYLPIVENWRQLPDGQIAFTIRPLPVAY